MQEPINLTDATLDDVLNSDKPIMLLFTNGDGLRGDFRVAFNKIAAEQPRFTFARINPDENPQAAARFSIGGKPTLIGVYCGEEIVRRAKPWGTDMSLAVESMETAVRARNPEALVEEAPAETDTEENAELADAAQPAVVYSAPVTVTDATFEGEVLNSDLPVLVDFWAAWCGPCRMVAPILDKLAKEFAGQIKIAKVNVDENPGLSQAFRIQSIPTLMIVKQRTMIFNQPGALPEASLRDLIQQAIALQIPARNDAETSEQPAS